MKIADEYGISAKKITEPLKTIFDHIPFNHSYTLPRSLADYIEMKCNSWEGFFLFDPSFLLDGQSDGGLYGSGNCYFPLTEISKMCIYNYLS